LSKFNLITVKKQSDMQLMTNFLLLCGSLTGFFELASMPTKSQVAPPQAPFEGAVFQ
jgi:hypothetical protein